VNFVPNPLRCRRGSIRSGQQRGADENDECTGCDRSGAAPEHAC
jgi:hypothetical protein